MKIFSGFCKKIPKILFLSFLFSLLLFSDFTFANEEILNSRRAELTFVLEGAAGLYFNGAYGSANFVETKL